MWIKGQACVTLDKLLGACVGLLSLPGKGKAKTWCLPASRISVWVDAGSSQDLHPMSVTKHPQFLSVWEPPPGCVYWAGRKVRLGFSVTAYRKTQTNFLANPIHMVDCEFQTSSLSLMSSMFCLGNLHLFYLGLISNQLNLQSH